MSFKRALERAFILAFLGFLCLSNVYVQGQASTPSASGGTTPSGTQPSGSTGNPSPSGSPSGSATPPGPTGPLPSTKPSDPPAHLTMLEPKANAKNPPLFPLGLQDIVFVWNITDIQNLIMKPTNLTLEAYSADNTIVTIASDLPGNTMKYTWPAANQINVTHPIRAAIYTIRIFDAQVGRYGRLAGGYLETYIGLTIGLYPRGHYTPGKDQFPPLCATCDFSKVTNGVTKNLLPGLFMGLITLISTSVAMM
ncbi:hypothetical protein EC968_008248 [Mortierella alpina]|nr:hypothetical protein EC968_008248 [Mortierella alpina]